MSKSFRDKAEAKKASANNPAMMFITPREETETQETRTPKASAAEEKRSASPLQAEVPMRAPQGREAKTRRLQLLLTPSLYEAVKERADSEGLSVNETIGELLQAALRN